VTVAIEGGTETLRTKAAVCALPVGHGFDVRTRYDAPDPRTRDYVYGTNTRTA